MPGTLTHSPADVLRYVLVDLAAGTLPSAGGTWPVHVAHEPNLPDSCITIYDTAGVRQGRTMADGEGQDKHGIQVRVRAATHPVGWTKANSLLVVLDESIEGMYVSIDGTNAYVVQAVSRTSDVLVLGRETPTSNRRIFTINARMTVREIT